MTPLTISCSEEVQQLIDQAMDGGEYASANDVVLDAMRMLVARNELVAKVLEGKASLDRGEGTTYTMEELRLKLNAMSDQIKAKRTRNHVTG
jgi:Arc/MetJ-type ribon-helix-helix transcriptional regulator